MGCSSSRYCIEVTGCHLRDDGFGDYGSLTFDSIKKMRNNEERKIARLSVNTGNEIIVNPKKMPEDSLIVEVNIARQGLTMPRIIYLNENCVHAVHLNLMHEMCLREDFGGITNLIDFLPINLKRLIISICIVLIDVDERRYDELVAGRNIRIKTRKLEPGRDGVNYQLREFPRLDNLPPGLQSLDIRLANYFGEPRKLFNVGEIRGYFMERVTLPPSLKYFSVNRAVIYES